MALAADLFVRPVPTRATLYARHWPEMARKARTRRWALETIRLSDGWDARSISRVESRELTALRRIGGGLGKYAQLYHAYTLVALELVAFDSEGRLVATEAGHQWLWDACALPTR